jgi:hypothetical protein
MRKVITAGLLDSDDNFDCKLKLVDNVGGDKVTSADIILACLSHSDSEKLNDKFGKEVEVAKVKHTYLGLTQHIFEDFEEILEISDNFENVLRSYVDGVELETVLYAAELLDRAEEVYHERGDKRFVFVIVDLLEPAEEGV